MTVEDGEMRRHVTSDPCLKLLGSELSSLLKRHCNNIFLMVKDFSYVGCHVPCVHGGAAFPPPKEAFFLLLFLLLL